MSALSRTNRSRWSLFAFVLLGVATCGGRTSGVAVTSSGTPSGAAGGASSGTSLVGTSGNASGAVSGAIATGSPVGASGTVTGSVAGSLSGATTSGGATMSGGATPSSGTADGDAGPNSLLGPIPSAGCGKPLTVATGKWVSQPTGCTHGNDNQGTPSCQAIPPGSTVPATATEGSPEYRGWWVYVPTGYDAAKPYTVIYEAAGCGDPNFFNAGDDSLPYYSVDGGQAILVGLDYDTYSDVPGCFDARDPMSNDLVFMPWLMTEVENTFCVDTTNEWIGELGDGGSSLAQQFDCAFPARLRGQVLVHGTEPGAPGYPGSLPTCNPAPMAAFYIHDLGDPDDTYASILPGCSRVLKQNGCSNIDCDPRNNTLTTPYPIPAGVSPPVGTACVQFNGCPAEYPVVFCTTYNQDHSDDQNWGGMTLFRDFISHALPARPCPAGEGNQNGICAPCRGGETACNGFCVDEHTDSNNCGACAAACPLLGASCEGGVCGSCPSGETPCPRPGFLGSTTALCVNQQTDPSNCGACQNACPTGVVCQGGTCKCPIAGQTASNGMCCPSGETACFDTCVNEKTDSTNCGGCGIECAPDGSAPLCVAGVCAPN